MARSPEHDYLLENDIDINNYETNEEFVCELKDGSTIPIQGTDRQMRQLRSLLAKGVLTSSKSSIEVSSNGVQDGTLYLSPGKIVIKEGRKKNSDRKLSVYEGDKPVLVVRVTDKDGKVTSDNARTVSDKLFGSYGDQTTLKSQFAACSFGKLQVSNEYDVDISKHLAAPGVINVDLPISLSNSDRLAVRNAAIKAVEDKLGLGLPGPFQHVMFILEACYTDCGWAAYSFVGGYISVYQGNSYQNVGIVMHEVG